MIDRLFDRYTKFVMYGDFAFYIAYHMIAGMILMAFLMWTGILPNDPLLHTIIYGGSLGIVLWLIYVNRRKV